LHALTRSFPEPFPKPFRNFGNILETFGGENDQNPSSMSTPSVLDPATPYAPGLRDGSNRSGSARRARRPGFGLSARAVRELHHAAGVPEERREKVPRGLGFNHCLGYHIACTHQIVSGTVSKTVSKLWKHLGNFWGGKRSKSKLHVDPLRPRPRYAPGLRDGSNRSGSARRARMAQIDPAPPAELVDPVSASPLEPFANPDAAPARATSPAWSSPKSKLMASTPRWRPTACSTRRRPARRAGPQRVFRDRGRV